MKSITIHGLDDPVWSTLKAKSESEGLSLNKTIKMLLESALGIKPIKSLERYNEFKEFKGLWSDSDLVEFVNNTKELNKVDLKDWE